MLRADIWEIRLSGRSGHEQKGLRRAVILQADSLALSTVVVVPTSTQARATSFRPTIRIGHDTTQVLTEQITAIDAQRLGRRVGRVTADELADIEAALGDVLGLD